MKTPQVEFRIVNSSATLESPHYECSWWLCLFWNPALLKKDPSSECTELLFGLSQRVGPSGRQGWLWFPLETVRMGTLPHQKSLQTIWLFEGDSPLGKSITFPEPCYILNFSLFMANRKWLELPHTLPSASQKTVQPWLGLHQWWKAYSAYSQTANGIERT